MHGANAVTTEPVFLLGKSLAKVNAVQKFASGKNDCYCCYEAIQLRQPRNLCKPFPVLTISQSMSIEVHAAFLLVSTTLIMPTNIHLHIYRVSQLALATLFN